MEGKMCKESSPEKKKKLSRRDFLKSSAAAGIGMALAGNSLKGVQNSPAKDESKNDLRVALIGAGAQGRVLIESCLRIPGIQITSICDIWE